MSRITARLANPPTFSIPRRWAPDSACMVSYLTPL